MNRKIVATAFGAALAVTLAATLAAPANAEIDIDVYVAGNAGASVLMETGITAGASENLEIAPGFNLSAAVGADFGMFRVEGEGFFSNHWLDKTKDVGGNTDGTFRTTAGMLNAYFDVPMVVIHPFVGAGIGIASVNANDIEIGGSPVVDDSDLVLAYQLRAGLAFTALPLVDIILGYRYFRTQDLSMGNNVDIDGLEAHSIELGVRVSF